MKNTKNGAASFVDAAQKQRRQKADELQLLGIAPFGYRYSRTHTAADIVRQFAHLRHGETAGCEVRVCGRIMHQRYSRRFIDIQDQSGGLQLVCEKSSMGEASAEQLRLLDRGDIIGAAGRPIRTRQGPPSVLVESWEILAKSMRPIPEEGSFKSDPEERYRQRHLDLILNERARDTIKKRSLTLRALRSFLDERGFLEAETPILQDQAGGAEARPFVTHHNALGADLYLRIAPEYYLRRLLVGGIEKVYEIGRNFRNEGMSPRHNPEFTSLELFQSYSDYKDLMSFTEKMLEEVVGTVCGTTSILYQGVVLNFSAPFQTMTMSESIEKFCHVDVDAIKEATALAAIASGLAVRVDGLHSRGEIINAIFEQKVQPHLIQPAFITDYPVEVSVCQQLHRNKPGFVERFELFACGRELANGCSELNDPIEQKRRFEFQARRRCDGRDDLPEPDAEFLAAMEFGMPPMMGLGVGIDRLLMLLTDAPSIKDVIAFPGMKQIPVGKNANRKARRHANG